MAGFFAARAGLLGRGLLAGCGFLAAGALGSFFSNSKPTLPSSPRTRKAENLRLVRLETKPRSRSVLPVSRSLYICSRSMGCCRMILPDRKSHDLPGPTDFSQT
jgi:hypothetical protein